MSFIGFESGSGGKCVLLRMSVFPTNSLKGGETTLITTQSKKLNRTF